MSFKNLVALGLLLVAGFFLFKHLSNRPQGNVSQAVLSDKSNPNRLLIIESSRLSGVVAIPINPMEEYDFKTKEEIYDLRRRHVSEHPNFVGPDYQPLNKVFGQIKGGKPWWGVDGIIRHGNTQASIDGLSKESQYINNPFLLVGIGESGAYKINIALDRPDIEYFPYPTELTYDLDFKKAQVKYHVSNYMGYLDFIGSSNLPAHPVNIKAYNARDFGLAYIYLDETRSSNVKFDNGNRKAIRIQQMLHLGGSCGHSEGCNNMSPYQKELDIDVLKVPALVHVKLWREEPPSVEQEADFVFELELF